jgi:heme/copper-type cytochrome/quinol oxidase subunit 2
MFFLGMIPSANLNNNLLYVIVIPLCVLGLILFCIFCCRRRRRRKASNHHTHSSDGMKSSIKPRQPLIHHNGVMIPSTTTRTSNDYIANSVDSIPITRQYHHQQQRYGPHLSSDLASLTSSNLYYARAQAL